MPSNGTAREHILVCLSSAPSNANIIRTAARMARTCGGSFTAIYVRSMKHTRDDEARLQAHIRLAERSGAAITTLAGDDIAFQIAEFCRIERVTKVLLGRSAASGRRMGWLGPKPLGDRLIEQSPDIEVFIIPDLKGENPRLSPWRGRARLPRLHEWLVCLAMLTVTTAAGFAFRAVDFSEANIITLYILGGVVAALLTRSYACSLFNAVASALLFNFFFTEPQLSLQAYASGYPVTFAVMIAASLITGGLAKRLSGHAHQHAQSASRTKVLFETNQLLQKASTDADILRITAAQLMKLLNRDMVIYPASSAQLGDPEYYSPEGGVSPAPFADERDIAAWVLAHKRRAGATTDIYPRARGMYLAIRSGGSAYGVLGVLIDDKPLEPFVSSVLLSILGECALALENHRNAIEKEAAAVLAKNEQLRADLLRAISHDLRTPLTSISGNAENLMSNDMAMDAAQRHQIASDIYADATWLIQLVENLLSVTRITEGRMQLNLSAQLVDEVITESLRHVRQKAAGHELRVTLPDDLMLARMDARLIMQVIINLIDNAVKYTPPGALISVSAARRGGMIAIRVADSGRGIPDDMKQQVFAMFYTGRQQVADCRRSLGLGLPLCRSIVEAHGGRISLTDNAPSGCVFEFTLPASEVTLNE